MPVAPLPSCPETRIMVAVAEQTSKVSTKTPIMATKPCRAGWRTSAVAWALGVEPMPASLEKSPRATP